MQGPVVRMTLYFPPTATVGVGAAARPSRRAARRRSGSRTARTASARPTPGCALVGVGAGRVGAAELLDDHRLAIVGRANQQQVGHALLVWPRIKGFQPVQRLDCARIADPAVGAKALDALVRRKTGQALAAGSRWDRSMMGYSSTATTPQSGRTVWRVASCLPAGRQYPYPAERACPAELMS